LFKRYMEIEKLGVNGFKALIEALNTAIDLGDIGTNRYAKRPYLITFGGNIQINALSLEGLWILARLIGHREHLAILTAQCAYLGSAGLHRE